MIFSNKTYGVIFVIVAAMCFGTGAIIIKAAFSIQLTGWEFITLQLLFSSTMQFIGGRANHRQYNFS